jgi:uncharacterized SAM-binding protein YcdF (DUF218 family)
VTTGSASGLAERFSPGVALGAIAGFVVGDLNLATLASYPGERGYTFAAACLVGALLWPTPLRRALVAATGLLVALWLLVSYSPLTARMARGLVRSDAVEDADAVFVFASRIQDDGDPTTDAMSRLLKGVELVAAGRAPYLVVSEVPPPAGSHEALARAWLAALAHRGEVLDVGPIGNTYEEARALARLGRERGLKRILVVTSPTHTRRAAATLEKQGLVAIAVPSIETNFDLETLPTPADRRRGFSSIAHEQVGLLVYRRRGWID